MNLRHLTDKVLLEETKRLARNERDISLKVLHHLKEIERRRLFSDLKYSSLFDYAVRELGYSEGEASRRIKSARLLQEIPELEEKIECGAINMTNLAAAAQLFKNENIESPELKLEILAKIENTSKRECEKTLMEYVETPTIPREIQKQVTPEFVMVKMNLSNETAALLDKLKGLLAHRRLSNDEMMKVVFIKAIGEIEKQKFKINASFNPPVGSPCENRHIPNLVKKTVYKRDGGKCVQCGTTYKLEFDHIIPYSRGGKHTESNLRLLCFSCNQRRLKL